MRGHFIFKDTFQIINIQIHQYIKQNRFSVSLCKSFHVNNLLNNKFFSPCMESTCQKNMHIYCTAIYVCAVPVSIQNMYTVQYYMIHRYIHGHCSLHSADNLYRTCRMQVKYKLFSSQKFFFFSFLLQCYNKTHQKRHVLIGFSKIKKKQRVFLSEKCIVQSLHNRTGVYCKKSLKGGKERLIIWYRSIQGMK